MIFLFMALDVHGTPPEVDFLSVFTEEKTSCLKLWIIDYLGVDTEIFSWCKSQP